MRWPTHCVMFSVLPAKRAGCLSVHAFRSIQDPRLLYVHSRWKDKATFNYHASLPHIVHFLEQVELLIDNAVDVTRVERIG